MWVRIGNQEVEVVCPVGAASSVLPCSPVYPKPTPGWVLNPMTLHFRRILLSNSSFLTFDPCSKLTKHSVCTSHKVTLRKERPVCIQRGYTQRV